MLHMFSVNLFAIIPSVDLWFLFNPANVKAQSMSVTNEAAQCAVESRALCIRGPSINSWLCAWLGLQCIWVSAQGKVTLVYLPNVTPNALCSLCYVLQVNCTQTLTLKLALLLLTAVQQYLSCDGHYSSMAAFWKWSLRNFDMCNIFSIHSSFLLVMRN